MLCLTLLAGLVLVSALLLLTQSAKSSPWEVTGQVRLKGKVLELKRQISLGELLTIRGRGKWKEGKRKSERNMDEWMNLFIHWTSEWMRE